MEVHYIERFCVHGLWNGHFNVNWVNVAPDVNILVGINGAGKTTLLNAVNNYYSSSKVSKAPGKVDANNINVPIKFIRSFDVPSESRRKSVSPLLEELYGLVNKNAKSYSFFDYRMQILNYPEKATLVQDRIAVFFKISNEFFGETGKNITIDKDSNTLMFETVDKGTFVTLAQLSAGEKQLLFILLTVFLLDGKPAVILIDEPELSLHISWQDKLIRLIRELNPSCQLIITTHSPGIFANGWEDKLVFMEDIIDG